MRNELKRMKNQDSDFYILGYRKLYLQFSVTEKKIVQKWPTIATGKMRNALKLIF